ncbi:MULTISPECIES: hypothetical protein [Pseudomonas]|uniref:hypothetical protein n=1 Tax=Pseudomonas TaxID=286 RepID=UPI0002A16A86|nr:MULTISPECIES: hypothetical protein [Pseudomonas]AGA72653.1 hypothetical protein B479_08705 [Pseudomonas putida HB3267]MCE0757181.1 hypothetical protein [Pseudomonas asiatica]MCE0946429.1 hypothetical protein [Pseudomonas asiatica]MCE0955992.1 hypothetical protein [Pseudomonas asiatica]MCE1031037.1 hypothetical protein [Pseudomonas asiatica]
MGAAAPALGPAAAAGGGILNAYSQIQQGKEAVKAANRQQRYLNDQARDTINQGDFAADMANEQGRQTAASQRTGFAANGVVAGEGSAGRIEQGTIDLARQDADQLRRNAFNQAMGLVDQGNEGIKQAKAEFRTRRLNAFGSLLTGGGQAFNMYSGG